MVKQVVESEADKLIEMEKLGELERKEKKYNKKVFQQITHLRKVDPNSI